MAGFPHKNQTGRSFSTICIYPAFTHQNWPYLYRMEVTEALFDHIAHLARLQFAPHEKEGLRADMQKMVSFMEQLNALDTTGVAPLLQINQHAQDLRADEVHIAATREAALLNAPDSDGVYFKVPKVIENPNT
jgi:aspartyl-tRNA(Asn)/glutamyl-tRNA(Gln) amidotransferase subunit C